MKNKAVGSPSVNGSKMNVLQRSILRIAGNLQSSKPPAKIIKDLQEKCLILTDTGLGLEVVELLVAFMSSKTALHHVETLILTKASLDDPKGQANDSATANKAKRNQKETSFQMKRGILMKAVIKFISNATGLTSIMFHHINLNIDTLPALGQALNDTKACVQWISIKGCHIRDEGLRNLTPFLARCSKLQVLLLEDIAVTDDSMKYIVSILKANEAKLDQLFYQASLRHDDDDCVLPLSEEAKAIYNKCLVAVSLLDNHITDVGMGILSRHLRRNNYLLGVDLRNNAATAKGVEHITSSLAMNHLVSVLLEGNPGYDQRAQAVLVDRANSVLSQSPNVVDFLPSTLAVLLKRWVASYNPPLLPPSFPDLFHTDGAETVEFIDEGVQLVNSAVQADFIQGNKDFELCTPSPRDGDTFEELDRSRDSSMSKTGSPKSLLLSPPSDHNNRPPSRNSLRPRDSIYEMPRNNSMNNGGAEAHHQTPASPTFGIALGTKTKSPLKKIASQNVLASKKVAVSKVAVNKVKAQSKGSNRLSKSTTALYSTASSSKSIAMSRSVSAGSAKSMSAAANKTKKSLNNSDSSMKNTSSTPTRGAKGTDSTTYANTLAVKKLADSVFAIQKNMERVSVQLKSVTESLNKPDDLRQSRMDETLNSSMELLIKNRLSVKLNDIIHSTLM